VPLVVRTWNVFHGNASPPERRGYLEQMIQLVCADAPGVVCLQELPLWAVRRLEAWSGMRAFAATAARPRLGSGELGRWITELHHGVLRSAFTGQANAILLAPGLQGRDAATVVISSGGERRVCQTVRVDGIGLVANLHVTPGTAAEEQLRRAVEFAELRAGEDPVVLCGDANLRPGESPVYEELRQRGYSEPAAGIDQILVRGVPASSPEIWPEERRRVGRRVLSDHAPVQLLLG
jgi:endonuclease/exonuclease/phosphatase family metal-dependent hydrolase